MTLFDRIRALERLFWRESNEHAWLNVFTWLAHGLVVASCIGLSALLLRWVDWRVYAASGAAGFYVMKELVRFYRGKPSPPAWPGYWKVLDPVMDMVAPVGVAIWLA